MPLVRFPGRAKGTQALELKIEAATVVLLKVAELY